jgi:predicted solute-binding protein
VRLLIDDTFATAAFVTPVASGWVAPPVGISIEVVPGLSARSIGPEDAALAPSSEILRLQDSHVIVPAAAVVADAIGAVAMRTPVRPDEVEATPVRLLAASGTAEMLARATVKPFYGIEATNWVRDDGSSGANTAQVVIVEGAEALREPEAGFSEDLVRAWFILTAKPVVTHLLLAPGALSGEGLRALLAFLDALRAAGLQRRGEWIPTLADRENVARDRASAFWTAQRFAVTDDDRDALRDLLREGSQGTTGPNPAGVQFISETALD